MKWKFTGTKLLPLLESNREIGGKSLRQSRPSIISRLKEADGKDLSAAGKLVSWRLILWHLQGQLKCFLSTGLNHLQHIFEIPKKDKSQGDANQSDKKRKASMEIIGRIKKNRRSSNTLTKLKSTPSKSIRKNAVRFVL